MNIECKKCEKFSHYMEYCTDVECKYNLLGEQIREDERKKTLLYIAMELEKDIPILENNYKYNNFGFQKGYWQGQLEYAYVLKNNLIDKANREEL